MRCKLITSFRDLFLSLLRLDQLGPILPILVLRVLFTMLFGSHVLQDLLLLLVVLLNLLLRLLDLALQTLNLALAFTLMVYNYS